jgi:nucleoside-diphosphate-sugar epimerase
MRITIIGCGWLGMALAEHWRARHQLLLTTTRPQRLTELERLGGEARVVVGGDAQAMAGALEGAEAVVLTLSPVGDRQVDADAYAATYLDTCRTLVSLLDRLPRLRQIIYTSSCGVYGDAGGGWVDESTPVGPRDAHGDVLVEAESLLLQAEGRGADCPPLGVAVLRLGALHGPGREVADRLARLAGSRRPGDGSTYSNWIHREDAVAAIDRVLEMGCGGILNVVDGHPVTVRELIDTVCAARGLEPVTWTGPAGGPVDPSAASGEAPANRRIRCDRLLGLGVELRHPHLLRQLELPSPD